MQDPRGTRSVVFLDLCVCEFYVRLCSAGSRSGSDDETDDDDVSADILRGRRAQTPAQEPTPPSPVAARRRSPHSNSSGDSRPNRYQHTRRTSFTRSRSPAVLHNPTSQKVSNKLNSPNVVKYQKRTSLPGDCYLCLRFPLTTFTWTISIDCKKLAETFILLASILYAASRISHYPTPQIPYIVSKTGNQLIARRK